MPTGEIIFRATTPAQEKIDREVYFTDIRNKVEAAIAAGGNAIDVINQIAKAAGLTASGPEFRTFSNVEELIGAMKGLASDKLPTGEITVSTTTPGEETTETKVKVVDLGFLYGHPEIIEAAARKVVDAEKNNQSFEGIIISSPDGKVQFGVTEISRKDANAKVDEYVDNPENAGLLTDLNRIHDLFWQGDAKREQAYAAAQYDKQIDAVNSKIAQTGQRIQASKDQIAKKQVELTPLQARKAALEADVAAQEKIIGDAKKPVAAVGSFFKRIVGANKDQDNKVAAAETALQGDRANLTDVNAQIGAIGQTVRRLTDAQQQSAAELTPLEGSKKELEAQKTAAVNNEAWQNSDVNIEGLRNTPWGLTVLTMIASGKTFDGKAWKDMTDAEKVAVYGNSVIMSRFMGAGFQRENGTTQDYTTLKIKPGNESAYTTRYHPIKNPSADSVPAKEGAPGSFTAIIVPSETTKTPGAPVTAQSLLNLELTKTEGSSALTINQPQSVGGIALQQPTYQEQPFSVGPNTSYEVSIYSSDNGHSAYAGPSARLNFADINSGPALQYNAQYAVRPDAVRQQLNKLTNDYVTSRVQLTEKITAFLQGLGYKQSEIDEKISSLSKVTDADELKQKTENIVATAVGNRAEVIRHAVSTEIGEQSKEDLGREITLQLQQVAQNKNNLSGFLQQGLGVDKALVATKLANLTYEQYIAGEKAQIQEYTQRINTVSEVIKDSKGDLNYLKSKLGPMVEKEQTYEEAVKSLSIKMGTMAKMRTNLENGISTGNLTAFAGWAGQELRSDKSISPGLDTRQQEMEQALNQDLSNVKQSQFAQYEKINDKALALPTWGLTTGYAVERKALYSEEIRTKGQPGVQLYKKQTQTVQDPDKVVFVLADFDYLRGRNNQTRENLGQAVLQGGGIETPNGDLGLKAVDKNEIIKLADEKIFNDPVKGKAFLEEATNQTHILYGRPHKQQLAILEAQIAKKQSEVDELKKNAYPAGTRGYQQQSITIQREEVELAALKSSAQGETNYLNQLEQKRVTRESLTSTIWGLTYLGMVVKGEGTNSIGVMSGVAAISRLVPQKLYGEQVTQDPNTLKVDSGKVTAWTTSYDPVTSPQADAIKGGELKSIYLPVLITKGGTHTETQEVPDGFSPGVEPKVTPAQLIGYQYGSVPELRFTKFFDYSYDSANVRNSISQAQVEAARTGNKMLEELLTGIAVYPSVADSGRSFANEPNNKDILGAYYNRYTTLYLPKSYEHKDIFPEGASYEGRGTADIISQTDLFDNN